MAKVFNVQTPTSASTGRGAGGSAVRTQHQQHDCYDETVYLMSCPEFAEKMRSADRQIRDSEGHVFTDHL